MQASFSELEYAAKQKQTRRDCFLAQTEMATPWEALTQIIAPHYPSSSEHGRPPIGLERILRMYVAQQCFGLSDDGIEDALYDRQAIRRFVGIDLSREAAPDATTPLKFRRLLEEHHLTQSIFNAINAHLASKGLFLREGTIVDATLIAAPPSTKNQTVERDAEMHPDQERQPVAFRHESANWRGCPIRAGAYLVGTAANVHDITQAQALLHGDETAVFGDAGYQGIEKREENQALPVGWHLASAPANGKPLPGTALGELMEKVEQAKASIRAKVEHPFHVVKNLFRHRKTRYKGRN